MKKGIKKSNWRKKSKRAQIQTMETIAVLL